MTKPDLIFDSKWWWLKTECRRENLLQPHPNIICKFLFKKPQTLVSSLEKPTGIWKNFCETNSWVKEACCRRTKVAKFMRVIKWNSLKNMIKKPSTDRRPATTQSIDQGREKWTTMGESHWGRRPVKNDQKHWRHFCWQFWLSLYPEHQLPAFGWG